MYLYAFATEKMTEYNLPNNDGFGGLHIIGTCKNKGIVLICIKD